MITQDAGVCMRKNTRDWWKFFTHFACGAVLGGVLGMGVWSRPELELFNSMKAGVVCISLGAFRQPTITVRQQLKMESLSAKVGVILELCLRCSCWYLHGFPFQEIVKRSV